MSLLQQPNFILIKEKYLFNFNGIHKINLVYNLIIQELLVDDSKKFGKPFELLIGKNFKLQCWESCVKTMQLNEVARFYCPKIQVVDYPLVSQNLRDMHSGLCF